MADTIPQTILNKNRQDKFVLIIDTPNVLKEFQSNSLRENTLLNLDKMQFSVISVNLPAHNIPAVPVPFMGQTTHHTSQTRQEYPTSKVKFKVDNNFDNYWWVWKWLYILNNPKDSGMDPHFAEFQTLRNQVLDPIRNIQNDLTAPKTKGITYKHIQMVNDYTDYQTNITLLGLREYNEKIIKFDYSNCFPTALGEINFDYTQTDEIDCYFDFSYGQVEVSLIDPV